MERSEEQTNQNQMFSSFLRITPSINGGLMIKQSGTESITVTDAQTQKSEEYKFDNVFGINSSNKEIYSFIHERAVIKLFDNMHCSVISLGQRKSGKSFTLFGVDSRLNNRPSSTINSKQDNKGIIFKVFDSLVRSS